MYIFYDIKYFKISLTWEVKASMNLCLKRNIRKKIDVMLFAHPDTPYTNSSNIIRTLGMGSVVEDLVS